MRKVLIPLALLAAAPLRAEDKAEYPAPSQIVAAAPHADWTAIAPSDLLVMDLAPDAAGKARRVVIQLMPPPFSQGWIGNIRKLAAAHWWDGLAVTRVQDNYVAQWGDPDGEDKAKARKLPDGLAEIDQSNYSVNLLALAVSAAKNAETGNYSWTDVASKTKQLTTPPRIGGKGDIIVTSTANAARSFWRDPYGMTGFISGWPIGRSGESRKDPSKIQFFPIHCYGMVGVGRNMSPDTGSGAELYTVIGHAPRHLDRNIALVGRVIEGIENLSSLPRGTGPLGVYESRAEQVPIQSIRLGSEVSGLPGYQYLSTESESFAKYAEARANRRDPFFIRPAGGADICNIPVPVRKVKAD